MTRHVSRASRIVLQFANSLPIFSKYPARHTWTRCPNATSYVLTPRERLMLLPQRASLAFEKNADSLITRQASHLSQRRHRPLLRDLTAPRASLAHYVRQRNYDASPLDRRSLAAIGRLLVQSDDPESAIGMQQRQRTIPRPRSVRKQTQWRQDKRQSKPFP